MFANNIFQRGSLVDNTAVMYIIDCSASIDLLCAPILSVIDDVPRYIAHNSGARNTSNSLA